MLIKIDFRTSNLLSCCTHLCIVVWTTTSWILMFYVTQIQYLGGIKTLKTARIMYENKTFKDFQSPNVFEAWRRDVVVITTAQLDVVVITTAQLDKV